jgi:ubiquinone/menaquinone biosynthesis C-methylase UbiE
MTALAGTSARRKGRRRFDFGSAAERYDRWYETPTGRRCDAMEKRAVKRLLPPPSPGARLLDVGAGTGLWSAFFAGAGFDVTGVDIAPEMIVVARGKGIPRATFREADAHDLPFEEGAFDVATAVTTLEFVEDAARVLREMARCTRRPGGVVLVGVLNALAPFNIARQRAGKSPYAEASLFSPREVKGMLEVHGETRIAIAAFAPMARYLAPPARLTELVSRLLRSRRGAFVAGRAAL